MYTRSNYKATLMVALFFINLCHIFAEDSTLYSNWQNADPKKDRLMGISTDKSYKKLLKGKTAQKVRVAVIDSGIDIEHEDLKEAIWTNSDEIPNNGIDDDQNGYIDDLHGWNFIGNSEGENINGARLELTRLYSRYHNTYDGLDEDSLRKINDEGYERYITLKGKFEDKKWSVTWSLSSSVALEEYFLSHDSILRTHERLEDYSLEDLRNLKVNDDSLLDSARIVMISLLESEFDLKEIQDDINYYRTRLNTHLNPDFDDRLIIGDNPDIWTNKVYGNNDAEGEDPEHGTMVAGVIGALRNNGIGVNGITNNIEIMSIRAVPDGDEWDKDIARSILYAIENGAKVINMSFGKEYSPQKAFVDKIVKMVDDHDVLLVHASGNDGLNIDEYDNFPNKYSCDADILANNWITVGSNYINNDYNDLVSEFSNYGNSIVDVFAPGERMLLCTPNNSYRFASGTSFAAPVVSGLAALLFSYYPDLTAAQVKQIILESSVKKEFDVIRPGTYGENYEELVPFSSLSSTGGIVNAYKAIQMAEEIKAK